MNDGEFSIELGDRGEFHSFEAIATDPNAEVVESDSESDIDTASKEGLAVDPEAELVDSDGDLDTE